MNKLKNKIFITILTILTLSQLSFILVFNIQSYKQEKNTIVNNLERIKNDKKNIDNIKEDNIKKEMPINEDFKFIDLSIYTVLLDENKNIKEIINHTPFEVDNDNIESIANKILSSNNIKDKKINNLYFSNYSYLYNNDSLIIIDTTNIKNKLRSNILFSTIIFIILELIFIIISNIISNWITKPVKETFQKQKQFIEDASHELKTPLSVIISSSELLTDNKDETKWLNNIKTEANRMNLLIKDLLELSSIEQEKNIILETGNLSKIIELSVLTFEGKIFENKLKLKQNIKDNINIKMNENNIRQLVEILLDNAIKHSKEKGLIEVTLEEKNNEVIFCVINEGEGIPKGEETKIFERFYRVDKSRNRKDNRYGLGLSIAKSITEKHNGIITAKSDSNKTTFKVVFKK